jgi:hypothetical protein
LDDDNNNGGIAAYAAMQHPTTTWMIDAKASRQQIASKSSIYAPAICRLHPRRCQRFLADHM